MVVPPDVEVGGRYAACGCCMVDDRPMPDIMLSGEDATGETAVRIAA
jgi:hypothetical protein